MASKTQTYGHNHRSPSPVTGSTRHAKLGELLGDFRRLYQELPELCLGHQNLSSRESPKQPSTTEIISKETVKQDVPPPADHATILPHNVWESPPATPAQSRPQLGRLDKIEKLFYSGSKKASLSKPNKTNTSTSQDRVELKAHLRSPLQASTCSARLQRAYGLSIQTHSGRDTSSTAVEPESPIDADDGSENDLVSKATTPATSPDCTFEVQAKIDDIVNKSTAPRTGQDVKSSVPIGSWPGANPAHALQARIPQVSQLPSGLFPSGPLSYLLHFHKKAQHYRSDIYALVANNPALLQSHNIINLPWDEQGHYTFIDSPNYHKFGVSFGNKSTCIIEPHYRVDKATQLSIVKIRLAQMENEHQLELVHSTATQAETSVTIVHPWLIPKSTQPIHVFVDMSNIVIGFC